MDKLKRLVLFNLLSIIFLGVQGLGQSDQNEFDTLIRVDVIGSDKKAIVGLTQDNFEIRDDKTLQKVSYLRSKDEKASIVVLMDMSNSTSMAAQKIGADGFSKWIGSDDKNEFSIVSFGKGLDMLVDWSSNQQKFENAFNRIKSRDIKVEKSNLEDGIELGIELLSQRTNKKKVIVVFSELKFKNFSSANTVDIKKKLKTTDVQILHIVPTQLIAYNSVSVQTMSHLTGAALDALTELTGGMWFFPTTDEELVNALRQIRDRIDNQYLLGYKRNGTPRKDRKYRLKINVIGMSSISKVYYKSHHFGE